MSTTNTGANSAPTLVEQAPSEEKTLNLDSMAIVLALVGFFFILFVVLNLWFRWHRNKELKKRRAQDVEMQRQPRTHRNERETPGQAQSQRSPPDWSAIRHASGNSNWFVSDLRKPKATYQRSEDTSTYYPRSWESHYVNETMSGALRPKEMSSCRQGSSRTLPRKPRIEYPFVNPSELEEVDLR
ncbi:hypothetical protein F4804DRAFT_212375 [Jackrogersella minutella]|nr:hypothetical protein F4804DRAFT_212375 [Jackrogersella minutella]